MKEEAVPQTATKEVSFFEAGLMEYGACWDLQRDLHGKVVAGKAPSTVIFVEHPPVLTLGKHADASFVRASRSQLERDGIALYEIDRGGEVTAHEPGQLVVYPILKMSDFGLTPKRLVHLVEEVILAVLADTGISGARDADHPGIWVGDLKIAAVGLRIKERVSLHGLALNVENDLSTFSRIVPCGIEDRGVTSIRRELGRRVPMESVISSFKRHWAGYLEALPLQTDGRAPLQSPCLAPNMFPG